MTAWASTFREFKVKGTLNAIIAAENVK